MDNEQAIRLVEDFTDAATDAVRCGVWTAAFLQEGGEPTWDAVKSVSGVAERLAELATKVAGLREEYDNIAPF